MLFSKEIEQIGTDDINDLIERRVAEGRTGDYKLALPASSDSEKKEFLYDISSFANASGGHLLYGIDELRDQNNNPTGQPASITGLTNFNADQTILRLTNLIRDCVQPRLTGVRMHDVQGFANGAVLVIHVPKSWAAPHMVNYKGSTRFYSRDDRGKYQMDVLQLRTAFGLSDSVSERARSFRLDRLSRIAGDEDIPTSLLGAARYVVHLIPFSGFDSSGMVDILRPKMNPASFPAPGWQYRNGMIHRVNFDGLAPIAEQSYAQLFRNGSIEAVDAHPMNYQANQIPWPQVEREIVEQVEAYLKLLSDLESQPPVLIMVSLIGVRGSRIVKENGLLPTSEIDRDTLILPHVTAEQFGADVPALLRPVFDTLWQAAGRDRSPSYDHQGTYLLRRN